MTTMPMHGDRSAATVEAHHDNVARGMSKTETAGYLEAALGRADQAEAPNPLGEPIPAITYTEDVQTGRTFAIGPQIEAILGYTQEEWMGEASLCIDRIHPDDRDEVVATCERANQAGEPYSAVYRMIARDGRIVWIHDDAVLVRGSDGHPLCWQGVMREVTPPQRRG